MLCLFRILFLTLFVILILVVAEEKYDLLERISDQNQEKIKELLWAHNALNNKRKKDEKWRELKKNIMKLGFSDNEIGSVIMQIWFKGNQDVTSMSDDIASLSRLKEEVKDDPDMIKAIEKVEREKWDDMCVELKKRGVVDENCNFKMPNHFDL